MTARPPWRRYRDQSITRDKLVELMAPVRQQFDATLERGNRFAERVMTVAHTARKQNKDVLEFLTECCVAYVDGAESPSLFARAA